MQKVLSGKVAIITGANQGFGLEVARKYIAAGCDVMLCARNLALLEQTCGELSNSAAAGQRVLAQACDVSVENEVKSLVSNTVEQLGACHILVNNAGIYGPKGEIESVDWADWAKAIEINVFGSILMCREVLPHFKAQRYGKVIQLSGGGRYQPDAAHQCLCSIQGRDCTVCRDLGRGSARHRHRCQRNCPRCFEHPHARRNSGGRPGASWHRIL